MNACTAQAGRVLGLGDASQDGPGLHVNAYYHRSRACIMLLRGTSVDM